MIETFLFLWLSTATRVPALELRVAQLEAQLIEKDRQIAAVQFRLGSQRVELEKQLLSSDAIAAECQLTNRAVVAAERLRVLEQPQPGTVYDFTTGRWLMKEKEKS